MNTPETQALNPHNLKLDVFRVPPLFARTGQIHAIKTGIDEVFHHTSTGVEAEHNVITHGADFAKDPANADAKGHYVLMAHDVLERIRKTEAPPGDLTRMLRGVTTQFRKTVLPMSPKRVLGLPIEQGVFRMLPAGAGPTSQYFARHNLNMMLEPRFNTPEFAAQYGRTGAQAREQYVARALGGQLAGQTLRESIHGNAEKYRGDRFFYPVAKAIETAKRKPGSGHLANIFNTYAHSVLSAEARAFEGVPQMSYLGKAMLDTVARESGIRWGKAVRLQGQALDDFVKGLIGTPHEVEFARAVDRMGGQYSKIGPAGRAALLGSPFGMWYANSLKFMYATMPHDHPILSGLMAAANTATLPIRSQYGLAGPVGYGNDQVQGYEQGGIPVGGPHGQILAQQYYSPPGAVADLWGTAGNMIAPQFAPVVEALGGANYKLTQATKPPGMAEWQARADLVINAILTTVGRGYQQASRVAEGGATPYDTSTLFNVQTKPGQPRSVNAGIQDLFKPVRLYPNRRIQKTSTSLTGGSLTGGSLTGGSLTGTGSLTGGPLK
jgi:hypothetical protein